MTDEDEAPDTHPAAFARNWKTVLLVDALVGLAVFGVGVFLMVVFNLYAGAFVGSCGLVYVLLVARRGRDWAAMRRDAGLSG